MKDARWSPLWTVALAALVVVVAQLMVGKWVLDWHAHALGVALTEENLGLFADALMQGVVLGGAVGVALIFGLIRLKKGAQVSAYLPLKAVSLKELLFWLGLALLVVVGAGGLFQMLDLEKSSQMDGVLNQAQSSVMLYVAVILAAPIFEELLCRGFIISGLERLNWPDAASFAVAISAFFWAMLHLQYHAHEMFQIFLLGVVLGFSRLKTQSLITPLLIHVLNNALAVL
ncbi:MAG: CPBP family intramembrane glutamic endopeptidase [Formosimonas sp.]